MAHACESHFKAGDVILLSLLEHHSNIVPWQLLASRRGVRLEFVDIDQDVALSMDDFYAKLRRYRPKLVAITHVANSFGTEVRVSEIAAAARGMGAKVLVDAAQSAGHHILDVRAWDIDFLVFSGHKVYGPTGIGVLYIKPELLDELDPFQGGGDMIASVSMEGSTWAEPPAKFEAGTPPIAGALGLAAALEFINKIGKEKIAKYERELFCYAFDLLQREPGVIVYGPARSGGAQQSIISFNLKGVHPHDLATVADDLGVQFRAGHHCAMPAMRRLGLDATARISFGVYSTREDVEQLVEAVRYARRIFA